MGQWTRWPCGAGAKKRASPSLTEPGAPERVATTASRGRSEPPADAGERRRSALALPMITPVIPLASVHRDRTIPHTGQSAPRGVEGFRASPQARAHLPKQWFSAEGETPEHHGS